MPLEGRENRGLSMQRENVWCALKKYLKNQKTCFAAWHFQSRLLCIHVCKDCCLTIKSTFPPGIEIRWKARYTCVKIKMWYGLVHNILVHNPHTSKVPNHYAEKIHRKSKMNVLWLHFLNQAFLFNTQGRKKIKRKVKATEGNSRKYKLLITEIFV